MATKEKEKEKETLQEVTTQVVNQSCPLESSRVCVEWSPVNELMFEEFEDSDGETSCRVVSDVSLLFNQRRLNNLGVDTARSWLDNIQSRLAQPLKETPNLSDAQLMQFIKSKHIQRPSELLSWSKYLDAEAAALKQQAEDENTFKSNLARLKARIFGEKEKEKTEQSE